MPKRRMEKNLFRANTFTGPVSGSVDLSRHHTVIERLVQGYSSLELPLSGRPWVVRLSHPLNMCYLKASEVPGAVLDAWSTAANKW